MSKQFKKKKRKSNSAPWLAYWVGMGVLFVGITAMVIYFVARPKPEQVAQAPEPTTPRVTPKAEPTRPLPEPVNPSPPPEDRKPAPEPEKPTNPPPKNEPDPMPAPKNEPNEPAPSERPTITTGIGIGNAIQEIEGNDLQGKSF